MAPFGGVIVGRPSDKLSKLALTQRYTVTRGRGKTVLSSVGLYEMRSQTTPPLFKTHARVKILKGEGRV